jgi:hypothetical protein
MVWSAGNKMVKKSGFKSFLKKSVWQSDSSSRAPASQAETLSSISNTTKK